MPYYKSDVASLVAPHDTRTPLLILTTARDVRIVAS